MLGRDTHLEAQLVVGPRRGPRALQIVQYVGDLMNQVGILDPRGYGQVDMIRVGFPGFGRVDEDPGAAFQGLPGNFLAGDPQVAVSLQVDTFDSRLALQDPILR